MKSSRRNFLRSWAAALAAQPAIRAQNQTDSVAEFSNAVIGGMPSNLKVLNQKTGLKIVALETFTRGYVSFVRVTADDGTAGWGQLSTYDADITAKVFHRKVARYGLGRDPGDLNDIVDRCIEGNYKYPWSFVCRALTGLDTAVWDLLGHTYEKPVSRLLGGAADTFPIYGSSMSRTISPQDEASRLKELRDSKGIGAFKIRVGKVNGRDGDQWSGRTEAIIPMVRKALGEDVQLLVDANSCYSPLKAIEVGRLLEQHGYSHFEEPCPYWELEWTAQVSRALRVPVAGGEQDNDLAQWRRMTRMKAVDIVQPDICYVGGLTRALRVAEMADREGLPCVPHSANLSLVTVFSLHMMAAIRNAGDQIEYTIEDDEWTRNLYSPALKVEDGKVRISGDPGWGVAISQDWLQEAEHEITRS